MLHFPSKLNGTTRKSDTSSSLNATQQKLSSASHPIFLQIEEELHDARRVHSHGQEDDLRYALDMVINRVTELSTMLSDAYKSQADLEVQLNVAKSNLKLVIANNEMLEDALKRDTSVNSKDLGWRRTSGRDSGSSIDSTKDPRASLERSQSLDVYPPVDSSPPTSASSASSTSSNTTQDNRFFKFRFSNSTPTQRPATRPGTPSGVSQLGGQNAGSLQHLTSPSMPSLSSAARSKELEDLTAELEKEKEAKRKVVDEKAALEAELESLSQALFEEANNMVATERRQRAVTEEELEELRIEKEALRSALRLIEKENVDLRGYPNPNPNPNPPSNPPTHSRSSSQIAIKSRPQSLDLTASLPASTPSPSYPSRQNTRSAPPTDSTTSIISPEEDSYPTPKVQVSLPPTPNPQEEDIFTDASPWADVPSRSSQDRQRSSGLGF